MRWLALVGLLVVAACDEAATEMSTMPSPNLIAGGDVNNSVNPKEAARQFLAVVATIEPVAERECRRRTRGANCDFKIVVDDRVNAPSNAYQFLDKNGRPIIAFTLALIAEARNADELAFVMGHEAAHHIKGHLARQRQAAEAGAVVFAGLAVLTGADADGVKSATELGAAVGRRTYSKDYELEADALGTIITMRAGYDAIKGSEFFSQIPDPGNRFLGSHPPNDERRATVLRVAQGA